MPAGLEIWDASGKLTLSLTDRISRYVGKFTVSITVGRNEGTATGTVTLPSDISLSDNSVWLLPVKRLEATSGSMDRLYFTHTVTGNVLSVTLTARSATFSNATAVCEFSYGVY